MPLSRTELARYDRHLLLGEFGKADQEKLKAARVLIIGAGGLGSPAALYLAAAGVGTLGIVDCDHVDLSNLQRQVLFDTAQIGQPKAAMARERLAGLNPEIRVVAHEIELRAANVRSILDGYDIVLDGSDRVATRYLVNDACVLSGKTLISAAIHRFEGQATTCVPGVGPCYRCLFPEPAIDAAPSCAEAGVLGVLPGVLGAVQATEAIKVIVGIGAPLIGRLLTYDALTMRFDEFRFSRDEDCRVCGLRRDIHVPEDIAEVCAPVVPSDVALLPAALQDMLEGEHRIGSLMIIDVREPFEFSTAHFDGAINVPLAELPRRFGDLAGCEQVVFVCRVGERSARAALAARQAGHGTAIHLHGGMLAWIREIGTEQIIA